MNGRITEVFLGLFRFLLLVNWTYIPHGSDSFVLRANIFNSPCQLTKRLVALSISKREIPGHKQRRKTMV